MGKLILKITPAIIFWGIFIFVILTVPYPDSLAQANSTQIIAFFAPLYLALFSTFNIFLKNTFLSLSITLGLIFILTLKALDSLDFVTVALTFLAVGLLFSYFTKMKTRGPSANSEFKNLTRQKTIPKLTRLQRRKK